MADVKEALLPRRAGLGWALMGDGGEGGEGGGFSRDGRVRGPKGLKDIVAAGKGSESKSEGKERTRW